MVFLIKLLGILLGFAGPFFTIGLGPVKIYAQNCLQAPAE